MAIRPRQGEGRLHNYNILGGGSWVRFGGKLSCLGGSFPCAPSDETLPASNARERDRRCKIQLKEMDVDIADKSAFSPPRAAHDTFLVGTASTEFNMAAISSF